MEVVAYIAVGANLGDRRGNIEAARARLAETDGVEVIRMSSLVENPAVGGPADSPAFLNGVIEVRTTRPPHDVLTRLLKVEQSLGRRRRTKWEPRAIDLDLVLYGDQIVDTPTLTVPHPLMHQRRFVLEPLAEIAPGLRHPVLGKTIASLLAQLPF